MIRAGGLLAMLTPLVISTLLAFKITEKFNLLGFLLAVIVGFSLHVSMNVYNDIYDTRQGADTLESSESIFSGGSAAIVKNPELESLMFYIARTGLIVALLGTLSLICASERWTWPIFSALYIILAFLSKYYTAAPVKFSYRGLGEIIVWLGFGPLAIFLGATAQELTFHPEILLLAPLTGLSTLIFAWGGEIVDMPFDKGAEKIGLVLRMGLRNSIYGLMALHILLAANTVLLALFIDSGWILYLALLPYITYWPRVFVHFRGYSGNHEELREGLKQIGRAHV